MSIEVYENTPANAERIGWHRVSGALLGDVSARWVVHNTQSGYFMFTGQKPDLDTKVTDEHARTVCKIGQGATCCRYLTMGRDGWGCEKFGYHRLTLDRRVLRTQLGIAGEDSINAQGDNCEGRAE